MIIHILQLLCFTFFSVLIFNLTIWLLKSLLFYILIHFFFNFRLVNTLHLINYLILFLLFLLYFLLVFGILQLLLLLTSISFLFGNKDTLIIYNLILLQLIFIILCEFLHSLFNFYGLIVWLFLFWINILLRIFYGLMSGYILITQIFGTIFIYIRIAQYLPYCFAFINNRFCTYSILKIIFLRSLWFKYFNLTLICSKNWLFQSFLSFLLLSLLGT